MHTVNKGQQQLGRSLQAKSLHLLGAKRRYTGFGDPDRLGCDAANLFDLFGPLTYAPVVPIERKPVDRDDIDIVKNAMAFKKLNKFWIDGREAA